MRFDHYIAKRLQISERSSRTRIASGEFQVNGQPTTDLQHDITRFQEIRSTDQLLQSPIERLYLKLHKPVGVVSATIDDEHRTVIDLIDHPDKDTLHLAGRLDRSSTGLVLLTNDSAWSEALTQPDQKVAKVYLVETDRPIPSEAIQLFEGGFHFATEDITTRPAQLEILTPNRARVTLHEGRWHQIKRMFHRLDGIRLTSLHRESIGQYELGDLQPGDWARIDRASFSFF
tara:strand:- start:29 stop:721 length:693 start_codon:yes stop_codon:yes gene_type:complete